MADRSKVERFPLEVRWSSDRHRSRRLPGLPESGTTVTRVKRRSSAAPLDGHAQDEIPLSGNLPAEAGVHEEALGDRVRRVVVRCPTTYLYA